MITSLLMLSSESTYDSTAEQGKRGARDERFLRLEQIAAKLSGLPRLVSLLVCVAGCGAEVAPSVQSPTPTEA